MRDEEGQEARELHLRGLRLPVPSNGRGGRSEQPPGGAWEDALGSVEEVQGDLEPRGGRRIPQRGESSEGLALKCHARAFAQTSPKAIPRLVMELDFY